MVNLDSLNPEQRLAAETIRGPVLILAGAGTGKTRVITFRIAHMVERGVRPSNILAVTFTNKAAREMLERVGKLLPKPARTTDGEKPERPTICTFHSLCVRILREHIDRLGYKKNFVIYDESEQLATVKKILSHISTKGEKTDAHAVLSLLSRFKNTGTVGLFAEPSVAALAEHVRKRYESALHACNAVDFDDLILLTLRLFNEFPDVLAACRAKYRYVMVDEYQDTNASQFQLVHFLTREHRNLCVVGDDDQSIYGWRGAEIANLLNLDQHFPEVKIVKLEQNYRSTNTILKAANAVIKNNARRRGKQLWSAKGQGDLISLHVFPDDETEARTIAEEINYNCISHRKIPWSHHAILFRTNLQSRALETELRKAGIRYHLIGGQSYFDRREVRDFVAYLKMLVNPHDDMSLLRIANVPARGLSDVTMERLLGASQERSCSVFTVMRHTDVQDQMQARTRDSLLAFLEWIAHTQAQLEADATLSLQTWAEKFLLDIGYLAELRRSEKNVEVAENRLANLKELLLQLGNQTPLSAKPAERISAFLDGVSLGEDRAEDKENPGDAVTLITMHSCKGLEFPHVYIIGLEDGLLPHTRSKVEGTLDEERRLFYVAITRAQETLAITQCQGRKKYGQLLPCHPSPFLQELPEDLVEWANEKAKKAVPPSAGKSLFDSLRNVVAETAEPPTLDTAPRAF